MPLKRSRIKKKARRHRELWRTGQVMLSGKEMGALRLAVYERAEGRCEKMLDRRRCNSPAPWDGWRHGELRHITWRSHGGSDSLENCQWNCHDCHEAEHSRNEGRA